MHKYRHKLTLGDLAPGNLGLPVLCSSVESFYEGPTCPVRVGLVTIIISMLQLKENEIQGGAGTVSSPPSKAGAKMFSRCQESAWGLLRSPLDPCPDHSTGNWVQESALELCLDVLLQISLTGPSRW